MRSGHPGGAAAGRGRVSTARLSAVTVFCGARHGSDPAYAAGARALGAALARREVALVYGGGAVGLMGVLADAVLAGGGRVVGVIPEALAGPEVLHPGLTETHVVASMHARKALMAARADAFIALPGGLGTLDELVEILTWAQLGIHAAPVGLLDVGGFWDPFRAMVDAMVADGFVPARTRDAVLRDTDPDALLDALAHAGAPARGMPGPAPAP
ncbi:MAG TPA: TIGR00730 family Rossman fold protein [Miltoncostaeaceae bacterium]|nr:TIGR00730 family Rossman fold protein [Miltoncostaeaceae bacterium]